MMRRLAILLALALPVCAQWPAEWTNAAWRQRNAFGMAAHSFTAICERAWACADTTNALVTCQPRRWAFARADLMRQKTAVRGLIDFLGDARVGPWVDERYRTNGTMAGAVVIATNMPCYTNGQDLAAAAGIPTNFFDVTPWMGLATATNGWVGLRLVLDRMRSTLVVNGGPTYRVWGFDQTNQAYGVAGAHGGLSFYEAVTGAQDEVTGGWNTNAAAGITGMCEKRTVTLYWDSPDYWWAEWLSAYTAFGVSTARCARAVIHYYGMERYRYDTWEAQTNEWDADSESFTEGWNVESNYVAAAAGATNTWGDLSPNYPAAWSAEPPVNGTNITTRGYRLGAFSHEELWHVVNGFAYHE